MWYVMQVQTGNEEMIIKLCEQVINTKKYERIFLPKCVTLKKRRGEWKELIQTLFPGYIFIDTDENRITDIIRACLLCDSGSDESTSQCRELYADP